MSFQQLQENLVEALRLRVRNGDISERRLARLTGVSQPHIHNVLKGVRVLSNGMSDRILRQCQTEFPEIWPRRELPSCPPVPVIEDLLGPGKAFPRETYSARFPGFEEMTRALEEPAFFRLAADPEMEPVLMQHDLVLVDRGRNCRSSLHRRSIALIHSGGCGLARYVWRDGPTLYIASATTLWCPEKWERLDATAPSGPGQDILERIRGRIVWIGRQMEAPPG